MLPDLLVVLVGRRAQLALHDEGLASRLHPNSAAILCDEAACRCKHTRITIRYHLANTQHWVGHVSHDKQDHRLQPSTVVALEQDGDHAHAIALQRLVVHVEQIGNCISCEAKLCTKLRRTYVRNTATVNYNFNNCFRHGHNHVVDALVVIGDAEHPRSTLLPVVGHNRHAFRRRGRPNCGGGCP